ncbi:MAG: hypothetical protein ACLFVX_10125 [Archaeoglobaceae archaeon]
MGVRFDELEREREEHIRKLPVDKRKGERRLCREVYMTYLELFSQAHQKLATV